jgi:hypothetical protein
MKSSARRFTPVGAGAGGREGAEVVGLSPGGFGGMNGDAGLRRIGARCASDPGLGLGGPSSNGDAVCDGLFISAGRELGGVGGALFGLDALFAGFVGVTCVFGSTGRADPRYRFSALAALAACLSATRRSTL